MPSSFWHQCGIILAQVWPRYVSFGIIVLSILRYVGFSLTSMWYIFHIICIIWLSSYYHLCIISTIILTSRWHVFNINLMSLYQLAYVGIISTVSFFWLICIRCIIILIQFRHQCGLIWHHWILWPIIYYVGIILMSFWHQMWNSFGTSF